jgi:protein-S-isoprenylcysteine O-methyltransferase Ste14
LVILEPQGFSVSRDNAVPGWVDPVFRLSAAAVTAWFVYRVTNAFLANSHQTILFFLLASELISLIAIILARQPTIRDINPAYVVLTVVASFIVPLFISVADNARLIPDAVGDILAGLGVAWTIYAKLSLGRSFGLLAAKRRIKVKGAYRFIRHPIYVGYFVAHIAFLLTNFSGANVVILAVLYIMQLLRAFREERILSSDETYRAYCEKTPYRFIYGFF